MKKVKVFIVDDSAVVRQVLTEIFTNDDHFELLGSASDPIFAMDKMSSNWPDVIVLDIEMPRMDGITFLKKIMREHPTPIVICSTLTEEGSETALLALSYGAAEVITKPKVGLKDFLNESSMVLVDAVLGASQINLSRVSHRTEASEITCKKNDRSLSVACHREDRSHWNLHRRNSGIRRGIDQTAEGKNTWDRHCTTYARKIYGGLCQKIKLTLRD
jgi:two-component system chemotaxis response regulator CheB